MEIEAVVFDFGGVLVPTVEQVPYADHESRLGLAPGALREILWRSPDWRLAEVGAISDREYWQRIGARLGLGTGEEIRGFVHHLFSGVQADERMVGLVRQLRGRYRTGLLSNASDLLPELIQERYGLGGLFDVEVISAIEGMAKPDPAIYRVALQRLGTLPEATVFVDDAERNVEAARALGIKAIHFVGYEAMVSELHELGVVLSGL